MNESLSIFLLRDSRVYFFSSCCCKVSFCERTSTKQNQNEPTKIFNSQSVNKYLDSLLCCLFDSIFFLNSSSSLCDPLLELSQSILLLALSKDWFLHLHNGFQLSFHIFKCDSSFIIINIFELLQLSLQVTMSSA